MPTTSKENPSITEEKPQPTPEEAAILGFTKATVKKDVYLARGYYEKMTALAEGASTLDEHTQILRNVLTLAKMGQTVFQEGETGGYFTNQITSLEAVLGSLDQLSSPTPKPAEKLNMTGAKGASKTPRR